MIPLWNYKYRLIVFIFLLAIILIAGIVAFVYGKTPPQSYYGHYQLYLEAPKIPYYPISGYEEIINCLIRYESGGNPEALGDSGRAKGILQFHESTFNQYCVERYNFVNNIWDNSIQIDCAKEMIDENWDNIYHWSVWDLCI
jgi:hypothetical protein